MLTYTMKNNQRQHLESIISELEHLGKDLDQEHGYLLESSMRDEGVWVTGNEKGLITFTSAILKLLLTDYEGAHVHFDEHTYLPAGSTSVTIKIERQNH